MVVDKSGLTKVVTYLKHLGLAREQTDVYLYLLENGPSTVLSISRGLKTGRTKLYPLLEELAEKQLIIIHERHYGTSYEAQSPAVLDFLVTEHERKASNLRSNLKSVTHALSMMQNQAPNTSKVMEYRGIDGLKQMNFNLTKAVKEFRVYELAGLDKHLGSHFADKMRQTYIDKGLCTFDLTNNPSRASEPGAAGIPNAQVAYINPNLFKIEFETFIYNNCVALLSYNRDDIFGVEIYNDKLARQQIQLFDLLWKQAKRI